MFGLYDPSESLNGRFDQRFDGFPEINIENPVSKK